MDSRIGHFFRRVLGAWILLTLAAGAVRGGTYTNPIITNGADPNVAFLNGYYYFTDTTGGNVQVRTSTQMAGTNGIGAAKAVTVFTPPAPYNKDVWAPEIHFFNGTNYIYYAADDGTNDDHRIFCASAPVGSASFTYRGKVYDTNSDRWAIDPTVFQATNGSLYCIWSGWPGTTNVIQNLYIAPMSNPWTISGPRVLIATPTYSWESWIEEGPTVLQRNGKTFVIFSANESWTDNECLGMLVNTDGNFLNPSSWVKQLSPVLQTYTGTNGAVYGPGGSAFTQSLDGTQDWLFYHAAQYSGAGWTRDIRMQPFTWSANGYPNFGQPIPAGVAIPTPSGDDFTPARLGPVVMQTNGALVNAIAPLPLLTNNNWILQTSSDLTNWTAFWIVSGKNYSAQVQDNSGVSPRFYRVKSTRLVENF